MSRAILSMSAITMFLTLQACAIRVPQAEAMLNQFQKLVGSEEETRQAVWLASFNGRGAVLSPYVADGYTVFANDEGDAVAFDGWVIRSVLGFGKESSLSISDEGWDRSSVSNSTRFTATCSEWQKEGFSEGYEWRQICGINGHETVIRIDEAGSITSIRQAFGGDLGTLELNLRR